MRAFVPTLIVFLASCASAPPPKLASTPVKPVELPATPENLSNRDLADLSLAAQRLQAQMDLRIQEYQQRPRKKFLGVPATQDPFWGYEEAWRTKVEQVGRANYPPEARGTTDGSLRLTVSIRSDGGVESIELDRSSGDKGLDAAAFRIVRLASPFAPFPPELAQRYDLLVITRTWYFGRSGELKAE